MKKNEELFTIRQAAAACGVTMRTLRYYEQMGLLKPAYVNEATQYRYYDYMNVVRIILVLTLKDAGMPLNDIGEFLGDNRSVKEQLDILYEQRAAIERSIAAIKLYATQEGMLEPELVQAPERLCLTKEVIAADIFAASRACHEFIDECIRLGKCAIRKHHSFVEYPPGAFDENGLVVENFPMIICVPVDEKNPPKGAILYPACEMAAVNYRGDYLGLDKAYKALDVFMKKCSLKQSGNPQEVYIEGEDNADLPRDQYITRVMIPVKRLRRFAKMKNGRQTQTSYSPPTTDTSPTVPARPR